jgi:hypothetical protein
LDRQACNNSAAYLFLPQVGSILTNYGFGAGRHPPRAKTHTKTGLSVVVNVSNQIYETGRKVAKGFKETMKIIFDEYLPKWNYRAVPTI